MAAFRIHSLIFYCFLMQSTIPIYSLSLQTLTHAKDPNFVPEVSLYGDAKFSIDSSHVRFMGPSAASSSSGGLIMQTHPFKLLSGLTSFSSEFSFSLSKGNSFGLDFVLVPHDFVSKIPGRGSLGVLNEKKYLSIEFGAAMDANVGDLGGNRVGVQMGSIVSFRVRNVSNLVLNSGEKLKSWIDYDASLKTIEVRLSKYGDKRPHNPIIAYAINLLKMCGNEDVFAGIIWTNSGNSMQSCDVYSWKFRVRRFPSSMHSMPVNPRDYVDEHGERLRVHKRKICPLTIVSGFVFAIGCGALLAFAVLFVRSIVVNIRMGTVFPVEYHVKPVGFRYEKINVVVDDDVKNAKR